MADVNTMIEAQRTYADEAVASADAFLDNLSDIASASYFVSSNAQPIPSPGFGFDTTEETQQLLLGLFPSDIAIGAISATAPTFTPDTISTLPDVTVPDFTRVAPTVEIPTAPSAALPTAPDAPAISDPVLPTAPTFTLPTVPAFSAITLPEAPSIELPDLTSTLPPDDLVTPTNTFEFNEVAYASALKDALVAKLLDNIENGGYGIETADESALFDRARSREQEAALAEADALLADAAARGFPLPPGDLTVALQRSQQNLANKLSGVNRDIALKRADLYVDNRKFTIGEVRALETTLIGYHSSVMERSLNVAKTVLDASIKIYETQLSRAQLRLERYKADASVFETRVRAALVGVEIFRTQMEGKKIEVDVQRAQVDVYRAQLDGVQAVVNLYKTQMEAAQVQANIEQIRIQAFQALIQAYTAQVQAKVAEFQMHEARIKGEVAKVQAYESEANAYTAVVQGARTKADILIARLKAELESAGQNIDVFRTKMEAYKTDIDAQAKTIAARVDVYGSQVRGGSAKAEAVAQAHRLEVTKKDLEFKRNVENARIAIDDAKIFLQGALGSANARVGAGSAAAGYYQALIGSALNSVNTLAAAVLSE